MSYRYESYDVIVVGAGHAGCEAALASARLSLKTLLLTISIESIALMPCNPNIGGTSKGHLVREIDALGGEMGKNIDKTFIQSKMLNRSKGPAVHSLRAQADKNDYKDNMRKTLENTPNLYIKEAQVSEILVKANKVLGIKTTSCGIYSSKTVILCTGTYLNARCIYGDIVNYTGPNGLQASTHLTESLKSIGIEMLRFKTGTPARIDKRSIDFTKMHEQKGDEKIVPFSFTNISEDISKEQVSCWLTYTNDKTHEIIRENLHRSPMFSGDIKGTGTRYCPSIEDKVYRFSDRDRHQVFIEPEGTYTNEMYISGLSTSLPEDTQYHMYRSVKGLENAHIVRNGYAIEYDLINPNQLKSTLELKNIDGLFAAGQMNGSSGYEEAAAQGLIAGINASMKILGGEQVVLDRSKAYIGVLIDDLVTKETREPYRMMTSRAEYRLLLRQDNADLRLTRIGHKVGLIDDLRYENLLIKEKEIDREIKRLKETPIGANSKVQEFLKENNSALLKTASTLADLIKRPELNYDLTSFIDDDRKSLAEDVVEQVNINIKYEGYINRQRHQVEQFKKLESKLIPYNIDYNSISSLRNEARQKLKDVRPRSVGQASRISGVSPSDISVLLVYLKQIGK